MITFLLSMILIPIVLLVIPFCLTILGAVIIALILMTVITGLGWSLC